MAQTHTAVILITRQATITVIILKSLNLKQFTTHVNLQASIMSLIHQNSIVAKYAKKARLVVIHVFREVRPARRVQAVRVMAKLKNKLN